MTVKIIAVGKLGEQFLREASKEYEKRLSRFCRLEIVEVPDQKNPEKASTALCDEVKRKEGANILKKLGNEYVVALCIEGEQKSSEKMAQMIGEIAQSGRAIVFLIGGSLGLSDEVKKRANLLLSMSEMTFPHGIARIILLEQIYRGYKILKGEEYHK